MIEIRRSADRGHFDHGWLDTRHTFSFAGYSDPRYMRFRVLRVMNEDRVQPGAGFGRHGHRDMEILSYVLNGALEHRDSLGNGAVLEAGMFQAMTAGTGVEHSEFNPSASEPVHFYQIWLLPDRKNVTPRYQDRRFDESRFDGRLGLVVSPDGRDGSLRMNQDALVFVGRFAEMTDCRYEFAPARHGWLQILRGGAQLGHMDLSAGDGVAISDEQTVAFTTTENSEVMLFDLP